MFSARRGDVILRGSIDGAFHVVDAIKKTRLAGPFQLRAAITYARDHGALHIFHQGVDRRGRLMGEPLHLTKES